MKKPLAIRKRLGLTQEDFANLLDMNRSVFTSYETGNRSISLASLNKLLALEITLTSFTEEKVNQNEWSQEREKAINDAREKLREENRIRKNKLESKLTALRTKESQLRLQKILFTQLLKEAEDKDPGKTKEKLLYTLLLYKIGSELPSAKEIVQLEWQVEALGI